MLVEVLMLTLIPTFLKVGKGMIALGSPNTEIAIGARENSAFMLIDGIVVLLILFLYVCFYFYFVR